MKINKDSVSYDSYTLLAEYYFKEVDDKPYNAYYERPATLALLPDVRHKKVLDAGCAAGWYTKWLLDNNADVIAIDFNKEMVEYTRIRTQSQCLVMQKDLNDSLDFIEDKSLDIVLSSLTLHYLKDWYSVFSELNKKMKDKGIIVFSTHHPFMDYNYFDVDNYFETILLQDTWNTGAGKVNVEFYRRPLQDIIKPILQNGFEIIELVEPLPTKEFEKKAPKSYQKLLKNPQFLFVKARKISDI